MHRGETELLDHHDEHVASQLHAIFQKSYRHEAQLIGAEDFPPLRRTVRDIREATTKFRAIRAEEGLKAVIEVERTSPNWRIESMAVLPGLFRTGLATRLLSEVLNNQAWKAIEVQTAELNAPALALYRKFGFAERKTWTSSEGTKLALLEKQRS